jgi:hypothetical protein
LELKRDQLERAVKEQASQINRLAEKAIELIEEQRKQKDVEVQELAVGLTQPILRLFEENENMSRVIDSLRILNDTYEDFILDLGGLLATRNPETTAKLLDSIAARYSAQFNRAKESIGEAELKLRKLQEKSRRRNIG